MSLMQQQKMHKPSFGESSSQREQELSLDTKILVFTNSEHVPVIRSMDDEGIRCYFNRCLKISGKTSLNNRTEAVSIQIVKC